MSENMLARFFRYETAEMDEQPRVKRKHSALSDINATVTEYGQLLEQVSADRAELLKTISILQLKNAELSVGKAVFSDIEAELEELREAAQKALDFARQNTILARQVRELQEDLAASRREVGNLKGQITKLKGRER